VIVREQASEAAGAVGPRDRYYLLEVGDRGEIGIWRRDGQRWIDLYPWTPSAAVHPGDAANELMVRASGPRLTLSVNGAQVAEIEDPALSEGRVGVFAGGEQNEVIVEQILIQVPDRS
jgi:hypothetical protein